MKKSSLNFTVNFVTLLLMVAMAVTGLTIRYVLPPGSGGHEGGPGLSLLGLSRHGWGAVHFWLAVALIAVLVLHVALHWTWVCTVARRWFLGDGARGRRQSQSSQVAYGLALVAALIVVVGGFVWLADSNVERTPGRSQGNRWADASTAEFEDAGIRGRMTLKEVARKSGMRVDGLKLLLKLPAETPADERLGRLGGRYGFAVSDARRLIMEHAASVRAAPEE